MGNLLGSICHLLSYRFYAHFSPGVESEMSETIEPFRRGLGNVIRDLLGEAASDRQVVLCQMSVRALCFEQLSRLRQRMITEERPSHITLNLPSVDIEEMDDHIARFSLGGIREIRAQVESRHLQRAEFT